MTYARSEPSAAPANGRAAPFRRRLVSLVLLLALPALGLALYGNLEQRRIEMARVREGATAISQLAAANQENFLKNSRQLLATLAEIPFLVLATNPVACQTHFANLRILLPEYLNFGLIESNGTVFAGAHPADHSVNLGDRAYFQRVIRTKEFATGDFQIGRLTGQPSLNFAYPVLDQQGRLIRVLFAALKLSHLSQAAAKIRLPTGGTVMVVDRSGNVLVRHPEPEKWVGKALASAPVVQRMLTQQEGVFQMPGLDGIPRLHAVTPITEGKVPCLFVSVGIPLSVSFAYANEILIRNLVVLTLVATVVFVAVWSYVRRFFLQPVNALVGASERLANGDLSARAGAIRGSRELLQLGNAFDAMAERLQKRQTEVEQANQHIRAFNQDLERRVTERTSQLAATNQELAYERHLLRVLLDNVPTDIYFKDLECRFVRNNRAHATRLGLADPAQAVGKTDFEFFSAQHAAQARADELQVMLTGAPISQEELETWPDGRETWALTIKLPWRDEQGRIVGTFGISHDITERKKTEAAISRLNHELQHRALQLEEANKELASFSYSVSHDLRTPLRGIDGFCQALEEDYADKLDDTGRGFLARVRAAAHRMAELIDDLLKLSQIARTELKPQPVDVSALAHEISNDLGRREPHRRVQWEIADGLVAQGDARLLRVALDNLLANAWKFTGKRADAKIEVGTAQRDGRQVFYVRDNGAGFDMAYAARLFGAFQRLHSQAEFEGTGIGLATVQRIVHRHGGRVWAEAEVDKGATVYFTL